MAAAYGLLKTPHAAQVFTSFCPPKARHINNIITALLADLGRRYRACQHQNGFGSMAKGERSLLALAA
jgi:hypothetical protein